MLLKCRTERYYDHEHTYGYFHYWGDLLFYFWKDLLTKGVIFGQKSKKQEKKEKKFK